MIHPQVVKYDPTGHYNVHHDAQPIASHSHLKCCHQNVTKLPACRLCRLATTYMHESNVMQVCIIAPCCLLVDSVCIFAPLEICS